MKRSRNSSTLLFLFLIVCVTFSIVSIDARTHHNKKSKPHNEHHKGKGGSHKSHLPGPAPSPLPPSGSRTTFPVLSFGAKGDGVSDDSKVKQ